MAFKDKLKVKTYSRLLQPFMENELRSSLNKLQLNHWHKHLCNKDNRSLSHTHSLSLSFFPSFSSSLFLSLSPLAFFSLYVSIID